MSSPPLSSSPATTPRNVREVAHFETADRAPMVSFYAAGERRAFQYFHATFIHWDPAKPGYINIDFGHHLVTIRGNRLDTLYRELILNRVFEVKALPHYAQDPAKAKDSFAEEIIIVPVEEAERPSPPADGDGEAADDADI